MKLTYRGRQYDEKKQNSSTSAATAKNEMFYRGNSLEAGISPKFPWIKYIKYLFSKSSSDAVFDPIAFWYDHKKEFLEECWCWDNKQLDRCWDLTLQIEKNKALKAPQKTELKYRGVTYSRTDLC